MTNRSGIHEGADGCARCIWCGDDPFYQKYHDTEWGFPVHDDVRLFEKISLEGFQAGLSWITILRKRENFRAAFAGFDFHAISQFNTSDVERLLQNEGIIRHRGKIEAVINNAARAIEICDEFGSLSRYFWGYKPSGRTLALSYEELRQITQSEASKALSKDLKKRGWKFVGPTTCYAFMQAMGLVNDHVHGCYIADDVMRAQEAC